MTAFAPSTKTGDKRDMRPNQPPEHRDIARFDDEPYETDRQFVTALARGLELLRCFGLKERHLGLTELAQQFEAGLVQRELDAIPLRRERRHADVLAGRSRCEFRA